MELIALFTAVIAAAAIAARVCLQPMLDRSLEQLETLAKA
jgi:hypothetical protein